MKMKTTLLLLFLCAGSLITGCGIFNSGCKCPKVSYQTYPRK